MKDSGRQPYALSTSEDPFSENVQDVSSMPSEVFGSFWRIPDLGTLIKEVTPWDREKNRTEKNVNWQFTADDARMKLKRLYPQFKP